MACGKQLSLASRQHALTAQESVPPSTSGWVPIHLAPVDAAPSVALAAPPRVRGATAAARAAAVTSPTDSRTASRSAAGARLGRLAAAGQEDGRDHRSPDSHCEIGLVAALLPEKAPRRAAASRSQPGQGRGFVRSKTPLILHGGSLTSGVRRGVISQVTSSLVAPVVVCQRGSSPSVQASSLALST
jgi:hypothetical protein